MKNLVFAAFAILVFSAGSASAQAEFAGQRLALASGELSQRLEAVSYFSGLGTEAAYSTMISLLPAQTNPYVKIRIVEGMDVASSTTAYAAVFAALDDANAHVRQAAVISLARYPLPDQYSGKFSAMLASDTSRQVKMSLINTLSLSASSTCAAAIDKTLSDTGTDPAIRRLAVLALGRMGVPEAAAMARKYTGDPDPEVKRMASAIAAKE